MMKGSVVGERTDRYRACVHTRVRQCRDTATRGARGGRGEPVKGVIQRHLRFFCEVFLFNKDDVLPYQVMKDNFKNKIHTLQNRKETETLSTIKKQLLKGQSMHYCGFKVSICGGPIWGQLTLEHDGKLEFKVGPRGQTGTHVLSEGGSFHSVPVKQGLHSSPSADEQTWISLFSLDIYL